MPFGVVAPRVVSGEGLAQVEIGEMPKDVRVVWQVRPSEVELDQSLEVFDEAVLKVGILQPLNELARIELRSLVSRQHFCLK